MRHLANSLWNPEKIVWRPLVTAAHKTTPRLHTAALHIENGTL